MKNENGRELVKSSKFENPNFHIIVRQSLDSMYIGPNRSPSKSFDLKNDFGEKMVLIFALWKILEKLRFGPIYMESHVI